MKKRILLIFLLAAFLFISGCKNNSNINKNNEDFANCLVESGIKEYGAYWCSHCAAQEELFGGNIHTDILKKKGVYFECDKKCEANPLPTFCKIAGNSNACALAGIQGYPTWVLKDGTKLEGAQSLETLAKYTGCKLK